jgi:lipopolysaccharide cholinephosphotransferase
MTNDYGNLELHKVLLSAMKDVDHICRENGLRYYLYAGTLLGAINHGGFIPWDDDVDIVMFPADFKRFCAIIEKEYSRWYAIQNFDNDRNFYTKMNALCVLGTKVNEGDDAHEIYLDVQVLHNIPDGKLARWRQRKEVEWTNLVLCAQSGHIVPTSIWSKLVLNPLARIPRITLGDRLEKIMSRYDNKKTEYVGIMCNTMTRNPYTGRSGYENDITKRVWHDKMQNIPFEDTEFMTISEPEKDLIRRYGPNWHEPYPEEKRTAKHGVHTYEISPEVRERVGL